MESNVHPRYEGVTFKGERSARTYIEKSVIIHPGATIYLSHDVQICGKSTIGGKAIVEGGRIHSSQIYGRVSGGFIEHTEVDIFATISGGHISHCFIRDDSRVDQGTLHTTTIRNNARFRGGKAIGSEISHNSQVAGGLLQDSVVTDYALITGGQVIESKVSDHGRVSGGLIERSDIRGDGAIHEGTYSDARIGNPIASVVLCNPVSAGLGSGSQQDPAPPHHRHPPAEIMDPSTGRPFRDPVCSIKGETQSSPGLSLQDGHKLYENFAVRDLIQRWELFEDACRLMQLRGYPHHEPFKLPSFIDPITSKPIKTAVLCSCGTTFDRESIQQWFLRWGFCPISQHKFPEDGLYPNMLIQRLIEKASFRSVV